MSGVFYGKEQFDAQLIVAQVRVRVVIHSSSPHNRNVFELWELD
jgi:hypothetical protein